MDIKETIPFTKEIKTMKFLGINSIRKTECKRL